MTSKGVINVGAGKLAALPPQSSCAISDMTSR